MVVFQNKREIRKDATYGFTGLGYGRESIYNSFDNIYVLNLVPSNLRKGTQYLKSHHTKGEDIEIMVTFQVRTEEVEQMRLF